MDDDSKILRNLVKSMANSPSDPLRPLIEEYLLKRDISPHRLRKYEIDMVPRHRPPGRLSPSSMCGCQRQAIFKFVGVKGKHRLDPEMELIFDDGNWRHHRWQATMLDMQEVLGANRFAVVSIEEQVSTPDEYVEGWLDIMICIDNKDYYVIDFKGTNNNGFSRIAAANAPHPKHVIQLVTYCQHSGVKRGWIMYENKDNQSLLVFPVKANMKTVSKIKKWCRAVVEYMSNKTLPPKDEECKVGNFMFDKCPWNHLCYGRLTDDQLQRKVYKNFESVEDSWLKGQAEQQSHTTPIPQSP